MRHTRLFWKLYTTYLIAVVLCAGVVGWFAIGTADTSIGRRRSTI